MLYGITRCWRYAAQATHVIRSIVLAALFWLSSAYSHAYTTGEPIPDFTLPSAVNTYAQRLAEQRGKPVMLLVLARCDACEEKLLKLQILAGSYQYAGLVTWVVWSARKDDLPPQLNLPVLLSNGSVPNNFVLPKKLPAVLLINRDGVLEHQVQGSLAHLERTLPSLLEAWLQNSQARPQE